MRDELADSVRVRLQELEGLLGRQASELQKLKSHAEVLDQAASDARHLIGLLKARLDELEHRLDHLELGSAPRPRR